MREPPTGTIETVRGGDTGAALAFRSARGAQQPAGGAEPVCLVRDAGGQVTGVASARPEALQLIAGRRFWVYDDLLLPAALEARPALIAHVYAALEADFDPDGDGPIGLCVLVRDRAEMERRPEAEWSDPRMLYAGYDADGAQVRIGYFAGASI